MKATLVFFFILALCLVGSIGCQDPDPYHDPGVVQQEPWVGHPVAPPPELVACVKTPNDVTQGIAISICGSEGVVLTSNDVRCLRCYGEFTGAGTVPVAAEGCLVWPHDPVLKGLCVNSCKQCGSTEDNY